MLLWSLFSPYLILFSNTFILFSNTFILSAIFHLLRKHRSWVIFYQTCKSKFLFINVYICLFFISVYKEIFQTDNILISLQSKFFTWPLNFEWSERHHENGQRTPITANYLHVFHPWTLKTLISRTSYYWRNSIYQHHPKKNKF